MREDAGNLTKSSRVEQKEQLELAPPPVVLPSHVPPGAMRTPLGAGPGRLLWLGEESKGTLGSCGVQPAQQGQTRPLQADPMPCSGPGWPQSPAGGHQLQLPTSTAWGQQEPTLETSVCCCRRLWMANPQILSLLCISWKVEKTFPKGTRVVKHKGSWRGPRAPLELE